MKPQFTEVSPYLFLLLIPLLLVQSTWLFLDARKRECYPWFWGIWGLTTIPLPGILYLFLVVKIFRRRKEDKR